MYKFSNRLAELMSEKKVSGWKLAQDIGVTRQSIAQYLDEKTQPNAKKICKIADYFQVSTDYLLGRCDYPHAINDITQALKIINLSCILTEINDLVNEANDYLEEDPHDPVRNRSPWFPGTQARHPRDDE